MAEDRNDGQERSQPATPRKLEQLRSEGQVPRSQDLAATGLLITMAVALLVLGPHLVQGLGGVMIKGFRANPKVTPDVLVQSVYEGMSDVLVIVAPFLVIAGVVAVISPLATGGWTFSGKPLEPNLSKLDPIKGLTKRVFTARGLMEMLKAGAKFLLVGAVQSHSSKVSLRRILSWRRCRPNLALSRQCGRSDFLSLVWPPS